MGHPERADGESGGERESDEIVAHAGGDVLFAEVLAGGDVDARVFHGVLFAHAVVPRR
jgi:hypothetical protein